MKYLLIFILAPIFLSLAVIVAGILIARIRYLYVDPGITVRQRSGDPERGWR